MLGPCQLSCHTAMVISAIISGRLLGNKQLHMIVQLGGPTPFLTALFLLFNKLDITFYLGGQVHINFGTCIFNSEHAYKDSRFSQSHSAHMQLLPQKGGRPHLLLWFRPPAHSKYGKGAINLLGPRGWMRIHFAPECKTMRLTRPRSGGVGSTS